MSAIIALVLDPVGRARIRDATRDLARVTFCLRCVDVGVHAAEADTIGVVLEPADRDGVPAVLLVRSLRARYPLLPVIAYCEPGMSHPRDLLALAKAGVNDVVVRGADDLGTAFRSALYRAANDAVADLVAEHLAGRVPPDGLAILAHCLRRARDGMTVDDIATSLAVNRKTVFNRLAVAGLPAPGELIGWCRLMLAAHLLERSGRPADHLALELNFPSGTALRNQLKRYTGLTPGELRASGALDRVIERFVGVVGATRRQGARQPVTAR